jgi:hypothetical protein
MGSAKVAAIHCFPVHAARRYRGKAYEIPAVGLGADPFILSTHDLFEHDEGPTVPGTNKRQKLQYLVTGEEIARCIVGEWTGTNVISLGMNPERHPGIWVVRDRIPVTEKKQMIVDGENFTAEERMVLDAGGSQVFRPATPKEAQDMWDEDLILARSADRAYAEWCWNEGNRIYHAWQNGSKEPVPREMPPLYKAAARQYGLDAEWLTEAKAHNSVPCKHCERIITRTAMICQYCNEPNDLQKWAKWKAEKDAAVLEAQTAPMPPPKHAISSRPVAQAS